MRKSRISKYRVKKIIQHFCIDIEASKTAILLGLNRNTVNAYYYDFRKIIALHQEEVIRVLQFEERYPTGSPFALRTGTSTKKNKLTRQLSSKPCYGVFECGNRVYTEEVELIFVRALEFYCAPKPSEINHLAPLQRNYAALIYGMPPGLVFNELQLLAAGKKSGKSLGIESFWSFTCRRMQKFNGVSKFYYLHLKECEWRWKNDHSSLSKQLYDLYEIYTSKK